MLYFHHCIGKPTSSVQNKRNVTKTEPQPDVSRLTLILLRSGTRTFRHFCPARVWETTGTSVTWIRRTCQQVFKAWIPVVKLKNARAFQVRHARMPNRVFSMTERLSLSPWVCSAYVSIEQLVKFDQHEEKQVGFFQIYRSVLNCKTDNCVWVYWMNPKEEKREREKQANKQRGFFHSSYSKEKRDNLRK